jgi:hypothetical protein
MRIDPIVMLAEQLRAMDFALKRARDRDDSDAVCHLLGKISMVNAELDETMPTSALGAAELLDFAAAALPFSGAKYAMHLRETAERLALGNRTFADLVWLRAIRDALAGGLCGQDGIAAARMIGRAITGAARPVVVYRAVMEPRNREERIHA